MEHTVSSVMRAVVVVIAMLLWLMAVILMPILGIGVFFGLMFFLGDLRVSATIGLSVFFALAGCSGAFLTGGPDEEFDRLSNPDSKRLFISRSIKESVSEAVRPAYVFAGVLAIDLLAAVAANKTGGILSAADIQDFTRHDIKGIWEHIWLWLIFPVALTAMFAGNSAGEILSWLLEACQTRSASPRRGAVRPAQAREIR